MKKIVSIIVLFVAIAYGFSSCSKKSGGMQVPTVINGPLGDYYDVVSVEVRPFNEEEEKKERLSEDYNYYKIIVEVKKNSKAFDFDPSNIEYESYISDSDKDKNNIFNISGIVNNGEGEELDDFSFSSSGGIESLLMTCSKEGATKKFSDEFRIKKEEDKGDRIIELSSILRVMSAQELKQQKKAEAKALEEQQKILNEIEKLEDIEDENLVDENLVE